MGTIATSAVAVTGAIALAVAGTATAKYWQVRCRRLSVPGVRLMPCVLLLQTCAYHLLVVAADGPGPVCFLGTLRSGRRRLRGLEAEEVDTVGARGVVLMRMLRTELKPRRCHGRRDAVCWLDCALRNRDLLMQNN